MQDTLLLYNPKECREGKKGLSFLPPREFQTPLSLGTPRLLINLPRNWLSQNLPANAGDTWDVDSIPGLERSPGGENDYHSSILAWEIPWTEQPCRLQSMGLHSRTWLSDLAYMHRPRWNAPIQEKCSSHSRSQLDLSYLGGSLCLFAFKGFSL